MRTITFGVIVLIFGLNVADAEPQKGNECALIPFKNYIAAKFSLSQERLYPPVESEIAERRLEEQYCLQFAQCQLPDKTSQTNTIAFSAVFSACLRNEALEKYDAVPR